VTALGRGAVFLLTDYGVEDEFAGVTRAVVLREAPGATVVDLTHGVPPFDVRAGALILSRSVGSLGPGVVVGVVDPGVGSGRRAVAVAVRGSGDDPEGGPRLFVGPDNGLLGWAIEALGGATAAVALPAGRPPRSGSGSDSGSRSGSLPGSGSLGGPSFDGRDLFAPVAARLWSGATLNDVGIPIDPESLVRLPPPRLRVTPAGPGTGSVEAEVLWVDRFGNVQLAARPPDGARAGLPGPDGSGDSGEPGGRGATVEIRIGPESGTGPESWTGRPVSAFADLGEDELGLLVDANGHLALVCRARSAATVLGVRPGDILTLFRLRSRSP
jgi:hypothetical protein